MHGFSLLMVVLGVIRALAILVSPGESLDTLLRIFDKLIINIILWLALLGTILFMVIRWR
jgi:hypothetical protein